MRQDSINSRNAGCLTGAMRREYPPQGKDAGQSADACQESRFSFDADALLALVEGQRQRIARAAGVDPSKVKIQFGH